MIGFNGGKMAEEKEEKEEEAGKDIEALLGGLNQKEEEEILVPDLDAGLIPDSDWVEDKEEAENLSRTPILEEAAKPSDEEQRILDILIKGSKEIVEEIVEEEEKKEPPKKRVIVIFDKKLIFEKIKEMAKKKMAIFAGGIFLLAIIGSLLAPMLLRHYRIKGLLDRGATNLSKNNLSKAEDEFRKAIYLSKDKIKILNQIGLINLSKGVYPQAFKNFSAALDLDENNPVTRHNLLKYYQARHNKEEAFKEAEFLIKISPDNPLALKTIGKKYFEEKDYKKARLFFEQVLRLKRNDVESLSYLQKISLIEKKYTQVLNIRRMLAKLVRRIQNPDTLLSTGIFYREQGELDKAEGIFRQLLLDNLKFTGARCELARVYLAKGKEKEAIDELKLAIFYDPSSCNALNLLGETYYNRGNLKEAMIRFMGVLKLNPENKEANYNLANIYYSFDQMEEAIKFYEKASGSGCEAAQMNYNLGVAYYLKGRYQEALDRWQKLIKKEDPVVFYSLGNAHLYLQHWEEAEDNLGKTIDYYLGVLNRELKVERPKDEGRVFRTLGRAYNNQGIAKEKKGQEREAMLDYFKALEAASWGEGDDKIAKSNLNRVLRSEPLLDLEKAIHPQVEKEHKIVDSRQ